MTMVSTHFFFLVHCDNISATDISKKLIQHSRTKHVDIRYHFVRRLIEEKLAIIEHEPLEKQLADIFTKPLDLNTFLHGRRWGSVNNND